MTTDVLWFSELGLKDLDKVGGKNASLGEMVQNLTSAGVQVPDGFATTADAYRRFLSDSGLDQKIADRLVGLDTEALARIGSIGHERADLMLPGCAIFAAICSLWPSPVLRVADRGLREGMLRRLMRELPRELA